MKTQVHRLLARREGMTLLEVLLAMAIFLVGSVSIMGLFIAAGALHAEAVNRRTASMIAEELLAEVQTKRFRDVYAQTSLDGNLTSTATGANVDATEPDAANQAALFNTWPGTAQTRVGGPLLIGPELMWYLERGLTQFLDISRGINMGGTGVAHADGDAVLQPRTWYYVLQAINPVDTDGDGTDDELEVTVYGDLTAGPADPADQQYLVINGEWMRYDRLDGSDTFVVERAREGFPRYTAEVTDAVPSHRAGTPVTVAREHERYPGFWYAVQYYPVNATGAEAKVIISVGYGNENRFRVHTLHTVFTPSRY